MVAGASHIIVVTTHVLMYGESKLLKDCTLPLTGKGCMNPVLTDQASMDFKDGKFILRKPAPAVGVEKIVALAAPKVFTRI